MTTTADKLRELRRNAGKNHDKNIRTYYDEVNAQKLGIALPYAINGDVYIAQSDGRVVKLEVN